MSAKYSRPNTLIKTQIPVISYS